MVICYLLILVGPFFSRLVTTKIQLGLWQMGRLNRGTGTATIPIYCLRGTGSEWSPLTVRLKCDRRLRSCGPPDM